VRIFLDTNVLVSAFASRGLCADVLRLVLVKHTLVTGEAMLEELTRVLTERIGIPGTVMEEITVLMRRHQVEPIPDTPTSFPEIDADDQIIMASAILADSDVLITGDRDLLDLQLEVHRPVIIDPRGFWNLEREQTGPIG